MPSAVLVLVCNIALYRYECVPTGKWGIKTIDNTSNSVGMLHLMKNAGVNFLSQFCNLNIIVLVKIFNTINIFYLKSTSSI